MNVLITGASGGIGSVTAARFLSLGFDVYGLDTAPAALTDPRYRHTVCDIRKPKALPELPRIHILFNNAGAQNSEDDIGNNLTGAINVTERYAFANPAIKSVLFNASASAISGQEFPLYAAAKAGLIGYMKNAAIRLAKTGATCNAICLGGVYTKLNDPVMNAPGLWERIMAVTPLKKWTSPEEVADWVVFLTVTNRSMSGQALLIDNGEHDLNDAFVWPE